MPDIVGRKLGVFGGILEFFKSPFIWGMGAGLLISWLYISGIGKEGLIRMAGLTERKAKEVLARIE